MARRSWLCAAAVVWAISVSGCTSLPDWALFGPSGGEPEPSVPGGYDFSWRLSGDHRAGPLQVFDDGHSTWLQFSPEQAVPAIFAREERGDRLLHYRHHGPYIVLDGVWPLLVLRAGSLESRIERLADQGATHGADAGAASVPADSPAVSTEPSALTAAASSEASGIALPVETSVVRQEAPRSGSMSEAPPGPLPLRASSASLFRVSPQDGNIRLALRRWAASSGWTFEAEHWAVDVDIPIVGSAVFSLEFDQAVQQLLASTELSDRPLQPCFYANRVLRVVPYAQNCDRSAPLEQA